MKTDSVRSREVFVSVSLLKEIKNGRDYEASKFAQKIMYAIGFSQLDSFQTLVKSKTKSFRNKLSSLVPESRKPEDIKKKKMKEETRKEMTEGISALLKKIEELMEEWKEDTEKNFTQVEEQKEQEKSDEDNSS